MANISNLTASKTLANLIAKADVKKGSPEDRLSKRIDLWRHSPKHFAIDVFKFSPSNQQMDALEELRKVVHAKYKRDLSLELSPDELSYASKRGISIRSGKGTGKDALAAILVFWFLFCYIDSKTFLVAPSMNNLKANLIAEMSKWMSRRVEGKYVCLLREHFDLMTTGCRMLSDPDNGKNWFVRSVSAGPNLPEDKQLETLQGKHARFMMFVIDEASGVPDPVFSPLDTTLTDSVNFIILIWNPTRRSGFAYDTHYGSEKKYWIPIHWNAENSSMVSPEQIEYLRDKYGAASMEYRVSVLGEPPDMEDDSLIPYAWCVDAQALRFEIPDDDPVVFGVDVARMGRDSSTILVRKGRTVVEITELNKLDTVELANWVSMRAADWCPEAIYVDVAGLGIGVYDNLKRLGVPNIHAINVGRASRKPHKFMRLRDELWWTTRKAFEANEISLYPVADDRGLISELSAIKYAINDTNKVKVEGKAEMRARHMPSPNKADALVLTMVSDITAFRHARLEARESKKRKISRSGGQAQRSTLDWMKL